MPVRNRKKLKALHAGIQIKKVFKGKKIEKFP